MIHVLCICTSFFLGMASDNIETDSRYLTGPHLSNLKASSLSQEQVSDRNPHVRELHLSMARRSIIVAEDGEWSHHLNTWGVHGNQHH